MKKSSSHQGKGLHLFWGKYFITFTGYSSIKMFKGSAKRAFITIYRLCLKDKCHF